MALTLVRSAGQADQVRAMQSAAQSGLLSPLGSAPPPILTGLAGYIRKCFDAAWQHRDKTGVSARLLECKTQVAGQYTSQKLAEIREVGGCETYFPLTASKCRGAEAWLRDVNAQIGDWPFRLEPTPIPDLPDSVKMEVVSAVTEQFAGVPREELTLDGVRQATNAELDRRQAEIQKEAEARAAKLEREIQDQLTEGGWHDAYAACMRDLTRYPIGIIKGPEFQARPRTKWVGDELKIETETIPTWRRVSPFDFFPAPNSRTVTDGYVCERIYWTKPNIAAMRGVDGWNAAAIDRVLSAPPANSLGMVLQGESERAAIEARDLSTSGGLSQDVIEGIQFWGHVDAKFLAEWNLPSTENQPYVPIMAILIGNEVIKAVANPDPLGRPPYFVASYEDDNDSFFGLAIPEKMRDCQDAVNVTLRNLMNNLAWAAGPMMAIDIDATAPGFSVEKSIRPRGIVQYNGRQIGNGTRKPAEYWQPDSHTEEFLVVARYFDEAADDRTMIPRYSYGDDTAGGAGATASGLNMLMGAAGRGIKMLMANIDRRIIAPAVEYIALWNLLNHVRRASFAGDCRVVARGASEIAGREHVQTVRMNFLASTMNAIDQRILGLVGRAKVLRAVAKSLQMDGDDIVPPDEQIEQMARDDAMAQMQQQQQQQQALLGAA